jgi:hypothetical protein
MDRVTTGRPGNKITVSPILLAVFLFIVSGMIAVKAIQEGWFKAREPLDLSGAPLLLFFNRHKGCECSMVVYQAAEEQINGWSDVDRHNMPVIHIDLDRRPDLGKQFDVIRAPALLLVDHEGKIIFGQKDPKSDTSPLDLAAFESIIKEISDGNRNGQVQ